MKYTTTTNTSITASSTLETFTIPAGTEVEGNPETIAGQDFVQIKMDGRYPHDDGKKHHVSGPVYLPSEKLNPL